jgi:peroxiredoxin
LIVVAVGRQHTVDDLRKFKESRHFSFTILSDPKREIYGSYATKYIPRYYIIGKDGIVKYAATGGDPEQFDKMKKIIEGELKLSSDGR